MPKGYSNSSAELIEAYHYRSIDVCVIADITQRMLQWWDETGAICPTHVGHHRLYTSEELLLILIICALRDKNITFPKVRKMLPSIKKAMRLRKPFILTDGKHIQSCDSDEDVLLIMHRTDRLLALVDIGKLSRKMQSLRMVA